MNVLWEPYKRAWVVQRPATSSDNGDDRRERSLQTCPIDYQMCRSGGKMKGAPGGLDPRRRATFVGTREAATP